MKKILLFMLMIVLFTGCKAEYNLTIDDDLKVHESVSMTCTEDTFNSYYKSSRLNVINMLLDETIKQQLIDNNYDYKIIEEKTPYVVVSKEYDNLENFAQNTLFSKQFFDKIEYEKKNDIITLKTTGFVPNDPQDPGRYNMNELVINIKSQYKVVSHNATSFDDNTNTYTWKVKHDTTDFELLLSIDPKVKFNPYSRVIWMTIIAVFIVILTWIVVWYLSRKERKISSNK